MSCMTHLSCDSHMIFLKVGWGQKVKEREGYDRQGHFSLRRKKHYTDILLVERGLFSGNTTFAPGICCRDGMSICSFVKMKTSSLIK